MEEPMSQTQAIFAHVSTSKSSVLDTIRNAVSQTVNWIGHTITYIANAITDFASKVWEFAVRCFEKARDLIDPNPHLPRVQLRVNLKT